MNLHSIIPLIHRKNTNFFWIIETGFVNFSSITYKMGKREMFNQQLNDMEHRYTYFVPRDHAWLKFQVRHPSAYKALFKEDFGYFVSNQIVLLYTSWLFNLFQYCV